MAFGFPSSVFEPPVYFILMATTVFENILYFFACKASSVVVFHLEELVVDVVTQLKVKVHLNVDQGCTGLQQDQEEQV